MHRRWKNRYGACASSCCGSTLRSIPRGAFLEQALSSQSGPKLLEYLASDQDSGSVAADAEPMNRVAQRVNQANLRLLIGLSLLYDSDLIATAKVPSSAKPAALEWKDVGGFRAVMDAHLALAFRAPEAESQTERVRCSEMAWRAGRAC